MKRQQCSSLYTSDSLIPTHHYIIIAHLKTMPSLYKKMAVLSWSKTEKMLNHRLTCPHLLAFYIHTQAYAHARMWLICISLLVTLHHAGKRNGWKSGLAFIYMTSCKRRKRLCIQKTHKPKLSWPNCIALLRWSNDSTINFSEGVPVVGAGSEYTFVQASSAEIN